MENYFQPQEIKSLMQLGLSDQRRRFFDLWVLKESYIKATGLGLAQSLKSFGFDFSLNKKQQLSLFDEDSACEQSLEIVTGICVNALEGNVGSEQVGGQAWSIYLGRLSASYRFGLIVKGRKLDVSSIYARRVSLVNVLNDND
ncbi:4'-phosphopantetheinyl transferase superfamily protein [Photobacterium sp. ZSDE20]|uniref:4'-phosphopantetheinyl transferase superfamily protein n=1 Tax=Photobacterium pectinilyticum TaxID=2906793 RepID=A0ABT1N5I1_9GAMM|nr:4'-phosphopantetheinyl transferase superfamily protein [Photobacterium sp. ZSDE20]MCQ1059980.1 4'-phosphopantetheinyl transferase superfamily protein [Photobacterium sp. ZSDE20]MDD1826882.1 4'-phosphopantetheinyl transferase superfamily protein [Photobacterium sp. ZSDE20]